jgi:hypothetical protein
MSLITVHNGVHIFLESVMSSFTTMYVQLKFANYLVGLVEDPDPV